MLEVLNFDT